MQISAIATVLKQEVLNWHTMQVIEWILRSSSVLKAHSSDETLWKLLWYFNYSDEITMPFQGNLEVLLQFIM